MVSKTEDTQLNMLESQVDNGGGGAWESLCLVRKVKVRRSEKVLKHDMSILNDLSLGPEVWILYEQVAFAAMDCHCLDVAKYFLLLLVWMKRRGKDCRFGVISMCIGSGMGAAAVLERGDSVD